VRALALDFERRTIGFEDSLEAPVPRKGEVRLRVVEVGVCATDRELAKFRFGAPPAGESRLIIGHEALCIVEEDSHGFTRGECVVPMLRRPCPARCASCLRGRSDLCLSGGYLERGIAGLHGYFAEFASDSPENLVRVPSHLAEVAALAEPMSVVEKAIERAFAAHPAEPRTALVVGAGPVGMLTSLALLLRGIEVGVTSIEPDDHPRAAWLTHAGAHYGSNDSADLVFEASGSRAGAELAVSRMHALTVLTLIGAPEGALPVDAIGMIIQNQTVLGVVNAARSHFEMALADLARSDRALLTAMIERRSAARWAESFAGTPAAGKAMHRL
jgi:threonine dehydrogenase-like Zn-dependent dehydrogenase